MAQAPLLSSVRHLGAFTETMVREAGEELAYYRLYLMAEPGGKFVGFEEIEAADDVEAVRAAEAYPGAEARELWCGKRKVKTLPRRDP